MLVTPDNLSFKSPRGFVVLDGVNGAGKSTVMKRLMAYLAEHKLDTVSTFEPGATNLGKSLRKILLENKTETLHPEVEMLLFSADRRQHVATVIEPALNAGKIVVSDRFYYSTTAFQGYGRGLDLAMVERVNALAISGTRPDLVILLDLDPLEGLKRTKRRSADAPYDSEDSFEREELAFHERLRKGFQEIAVRYPERFLVVDASRSPDEVFDEVRKAIDLLLAALKQR